VLWAEHADVAKLDPIFQRRFRKVRRRQDHGRRRAWVDVINYFGGRRNIAARFGTAVTKQTDHDFLCTFVATALQVVDWLSDAKFNGILSEAERTPTR
jgi:hypothetical protein